MEKTIARFHCTIMKMEISILYHVIVNSQSNRDNLTRCCITTHIPLELMVYMCVCVYIYIYIYIYIYEYRNQIHYATSAIILLKY